MWANIEDLIIYLQTIFAEQDQKTSDIKLAVKFNNCKASVCRLPFFKTDVYTFLPEDLNSWLEESLPCGDYRQTILEFEFDKGAKIITGLWWLWHVNQKPDFLKLS